MWFVVGDIDAVEPRLNVTRFGGVLDSPGCLKMDVNDFCLEETVCGNRGKLLVDLV